MNITVKMTLITVLCFAVALSFPACTEDEVTNSDGVGVLDCEAEPTTPPDNDTVYADSVSLKWIYTATGDCDESPSFQTFLLIGPQMDYSGQDMTYDDSTMFRDLVYDTAYYWYIISRNADYDSSVSDTFCFYTSSLVPGMAMNPSPEDGATDVSLHPALEWEVHNPESETYRFDVYFGTDADPSLAEANLSDALYDPGELDAATTYYWKVAAFTNDDDTTWGPVWSFTTSDMVEIYGLFEVDCYFQDQYYQYIELRARFDSVYAPIEAIDPITSYTVEFVLPDATALPLTVNPTTSVYSRIEISDVLIQLGETYGYSVTRSPFTFDLTLPTCVAQITAPQSLESLPNNGFDVEWTGTECGGYVWITIMKYSNLGVPDSANVWVYTENDGAYTLTAGDLADLEPSWMNMYDVLVIRQEEISFNAGGWLEQSMIRIRLYDKVEGVYLVSPGK